MVEEEIVYVKTRFWKPHMLTLVQLHTTMEEKLEFQRKHTLSMHFFAEHGVVSLRLIHVQ